MAAEAEASREARAKVIAADGEMRASRALKEASSVIDQSPSALQLRYLQVSVEGAFVPCENHRTMMGQWMDAFLDFISKEMDSFLRGPTRRCTARTSARNVMDVGYVLCVPPTSPPMMVGVQLRDQCWRHLRGSA